MNGIQTELDYLMGDFPACFRDTPLAIPKGSIPSDKQKCQPKAQHEFISMARKLWQHQEKMRLKSTDIKKSNIMEKNYTDKLEKKIDFLTDIF